MANILAISKQASEFSTVNKLSLEDGKLEKRVLV